MAKDKRKFEKVSKVLDVDKKKDKYERHKYKSSVLQIASSHNKANSWSWVCGGTQIEACVGWSHKC